MPGKFLQGVKRFVLWDYPRACWQYDLMVALILGFIFLTPRGWFRDQPRPSNIVMLQTHEGIETYWIEPDLLAKVPEDRQPAAAAEMLHHRHGQKLRLVRLEPIYDSEQEIKGYVALVKP
jgi:hypothetical protein